MATSLFLFPFCFAGVLNAASIAAASFANVLGDVSSYCGSPSSPVVFSMPAIFACVSDISSNGIYFSYQVSALLVVVLFWPFLGFFFSLSILFLFSIFGVVLFLILGITVGFSSFSSASYSSSISCSSSV